MSPVPIFRDRSLAGEELSVEIASQLAELSNTGFSPKPIVYALPRGGLPVAVPVARRLNCPLTILVAKKITRVKNPELAIGAVTADGYVVWGQSFVPDKNSERDRQVREAALKVAEAKALAQQEQLAPACPPVNAKETIAILIDDGIATGMTMAAAAGSVRSQEPAQVWICAPVAPPELMGWLCQWSDRSLVLATPYPFLSVSRFYEQFPQVSMEEALNSLRQHNYPLP
ncbi:MAG: phosphoribosyltransferase [Oscillatoria sp. SIO1A7]|nr:phosphoribosyltransferase [Oscillatoria sp. SIO1A7]